MSSQPIVKPKFCVDCRHHTAKPGAAPPFDHMCSSQNRYTVSMVTGEKMLRSDHPHYSTCEGQRPRSGVYEGGNSRCGSHAQWFEPKQPEAE